MTESSTSEPLPSPIEPSGTQTSWYRAIWFTIFSLIVIFPLGLYLMWTNKPGWSQRVRWIATAAVAFAVIVVVAGASGGGKENASSPTSFVPTSTATATPTSTASPASTPASMPSPESISTISPSSSSSSLEITGYGATRADWNAHHNADNTFDAGSVYDQDATLPKINGNVGAKYVAVGPSNGRITHYQINLHPGTSLVAARAEVMNEFPSDVQIAWATSKDSCFQMAVNSPTLGKALSSLGDPTGSVLIEFDSGVSNGNFAYQASNVTEATTILANNPSESDSMC